MKRLAFCAIAVSLLFSTAFAGNPAGNNFVAVSSTSWTPALPTSSGGVSPVLWLRSDAGLYQAVAGAAAVSDGDVVGQWQDQSGNVNHAVQATTINKPLLKLVGVKPVVRWDGSNDFMLLTAVLPETNFTVFIVLSADNNTGSRFALCSTKTGGTDGLVVVGNNETNIRGDAGKVGFNTGDIETATLTYGVPYIHTVSGGGGTFSSWINGGTAETGSFVNDAFSVSAVGSFYEAGPAFNLFDGDIYEIIVYASNIATADKNQVGAYLDGRHSPTWTTIP